MEKNLKAMVELTSAPYDDDTIPFATASYVVDIDRELAVSSSSYSSSSSPAPRWVSAVPTEAIPLVTPMTSTTSSPQISRTVIVETESLSEQPQRQQQHVEDNLTLPTESSSIQAAQHPEEDEGVLAGRRKVAAGTAGAVIGLFLGGPVISVVLGLGTAYYTKQEGVTGDLARALGDVALVARDKFREVDSEHHILENGRAAAVEVFHRAQQHHHQVQNSTQQPRQQPCGGASRSAPLQDQCLRLVSICWRTTVDFVERHHLVERGCNALVLLIEQVSVKVKEHHRRVQEDESRRSSRGCGCGPPPPRQEMKPSSL